MNTICHRPMPRPARAPLGRPRHLGAPRSSLVRLVGVAIALLCLAGLALAQTPEGSVNTQLRDGNYYFAQGDCALAQYFYQEALKGNPELVEALVGKGRALACQGAYGSAVEAFREAIDASPNYTPAHVQLALAYQNQYLNDPITYGGRLADALDIMTRAEQVDPNDATIQNTKGILYFESGSLDQARSSLERAVELATGSGLSSRERSVIQVNLGRTYRDLGLLELAQAAFRRAVVLDPASASAHNNLGHVAYRLGDCDSAEYELSQAVSLAPNSLSTVSQLATALFECGDVAGSLPHFEHALTLDGAVFAPPLYTYLARAYQAQGRLADAVRFAQQGALLLPHTADAYYHLGQIYLARNAAGDVEAARDAFEYALELDPGYTDATQALNSLR